MFLTDFPDIFDVAVDEAVSPIHDIIVAAPAVPEGIRSPRHQMFSDLPTPAYNQTSFYQQAGGNLQLGRGFYGGNDMGFIPMQPSYEPVEYASHGTSEGHGSSEGAVAAPKETKAKRRESGMVMASRGLATQRKGSLQRLREEMGMVREERALQ